MAPNDGWSPERTSHGQRLGMFNATPEGRRAEHGVHQTCLVRQLPSIPAAWGSGSFRVGEHAGDLGGGASTGPTLPMSPSACSSGSSVTSFSSKPVTEACFPKFCDALYQINRPEEGAVGT